MDKIKKCIKCNELKQLSEYYFRKEANNYRADCKACFNQRQKQSPSYTKEARAEKWQEMKDDPEQLERQREKNREACRRYRAKYPDRRRATNQKYNKDNRDARNEYQRGYLRDRRAKDPALRLIHRSRTRVRLALKGVGKDAPTIELLGCTAEQFRKHIESKLTDGMTFDNVHIDHRLPISAFDLTKPKHQRYAFHWSNCQPLFVADNLAKSDKYCPKEVEAYLKSDLAKPL